MKHEIPILKQSTITNYRKDKKLNPSRYELMMVDKPKKETRELPEISALRLAKNIKDALIDAEVPEKHIKKCAVAVINVILSSPECSILVIRCGDNKPILGIKFDKFMQRVLDAIK